MKCIYPVSQEQVLNGTTFRFRRRCGNCETCRMRYRAEWSARILLEAHCHDASSFITLTYAKETYPHDGSLRKRDLQLFFKRLRRNLDRLNEGRSVRYFACGEYGDRTQRAHYHCVLFGLEAGIGLEKLIESSWGNGWITVAPLSAQRSSYVARYTTKKLRGGVPPGRAPEFALMSRRPGLGMQFVERLADAVKRQIVPLGDPKDGHPVLNLWRGYVHVDGRFYPASRYFRKKLIEACGAQGSELRAAVTRLMSAWNSEAKPHDVVALKRSARLRLDKGGVL